MQPRPIRIGTRPTLSGRRYLSANWRAGRPVSLPIAKRSQPALAVERDAVLGDGRMEHWQFPAMRAWPRYRIHALHLRSELE